MGAWKEQLREVQRVWRTSTQTTRNGARSSSVAAAAKASTFAESQAAPGPMGTSAERPALQPFTPLIDCGRKLSLPSWARLGRLLQHPGHRRGGLPMTVRMGLDFGSAFTKVVILAGRDRIAVDFSHITGDKSPSARFVLPGFIHQQSAGEYGWFGGHADTVHGNLKLGVMDTLGGSKCPERTITFLALVIRYARACLYAHRDIGRRLSGRELRWELNIGCPTEPYESPEIAQFFRRLAQTAWSLAVAERLSEGLVAEAWRQEPPAKGLATPPNVVPEFVAQIAGYLKSNQVSQGLHALVDVGAGTLDVAVFNIVPDRGVGMLHIPIFGSAVKRFGTHYLSQYRHSKLGLDATWDDSAPVLSSAAFSKLHRKKEAEVLRAEREFEGSVCQTVSKIVNSVRIQAGLGSDPAWRNGLPVFITGGGANVDLYARAVNRAEGAVQRQISENSSFRFISMPASGGRVSGIAEDQRGRLSVAIGLSEDPENIARVTPSNQIPPLVMGRAERPPLPEV